MNPLSPQVANLLRRVDVTPRGSEQVAAAERALEVARGTGVFEDELRARLAVVHAYYYVPTPPENFAHHVWLRRALDRPVQIDAELRRQIFWTLKWAVSEMINNPDLPLDAVYSMLDDVEAALVAEGWQLRPVHAFRAELALLTGRSEQAAEHNELLRTTPRDRMSDCEACELNGTAQRQAWDGDPQTALQTLAPVLEGRLSCTHEPHRSHALAGLWEQMVNHPEKAHAQFRTGWHLVADNPAMAQPVARHLVTLTRLGNVDRALPLLLARLHWADQSQPPYFTAVFCAAATLVLDAALAAGLAPEQVDGRPTPEVCDDLRARTEQLGARFDARWGSTVVSAELAELMDLAQVSGESFLPPLHAAVSVVPAAEQLPEDPAELAALWARESAAGVDVRPLARHWLRIRERVHRSGTDCARLDRLSTRVAEPDQRRDLLQTAMQAARDGDDPGQLGRAQISLMLLQAQEADEPAQRAERLTRARQRADQLAADGYPADAAGAWYEIAGADDDRHAALHRSAELYRKAPLEENRTWLVLALVDLAEITDAEPAVQALLQEATAALEGSEEPARTRMRTLLRTVVALRLARAGQLPEAVADLDATIAADTPPRTYRAQLLRLDLLTRLEEWARVAEAAEQLTRQSAQQREDLLLARAQHHLGRARLELGQPGDAAELLEAALPTLRREDPDQVGMTVWLLAHALSEIGEWEAARTAFAEAASTAEAAGQAGAVAHAHLLAGDSAMNGDDSTAAAVHYEAAAEHARTAVDVETLVAALRKNATITARTDLPAALAVLAAIPATVQEVTAQAVGEEPPEQIDLDILQALLMHQSAFLTGDHGDRQEGIALMRAAVARGEELSIPGLISAFNVDLAAQLALGGQFDEAEQLLRSLAGPQAPEPAFGSALSLLCSALAEDGHEERADTLWFALQPDQ